MYGNGDLLGFYWMMMIVTMMAVTLRKRAVVISCEWRLIGKDNLVKTCVGITQMTGQTNIEIRYCCYKYKYNVTNTMLQIQCYKYSLNI